MENNIDTQLVLPPSAKKEYLKKASKHIVKILYLIEDEKNGKIATDSAKEYICGQLFELGTANALFDNTLVEVVVKLNSALKYQTEEFKQIRKQILEAKAIVDHLINSL